ncbi:PREDICTED: ADP-ribosylation factor-like protein 2-binding protein-like protein [Cercocebus atys]|uniref:ADP-ribosylation factor-like protein 2-binding protein-like protein n=1 Tax=Cercocebus atys TaxID=9531 RepID=UPI0005F577EE|nr:PREDICTED: ADP-ribosylation factor-like protein 2-binding protein-like protein [Cercocebus atys]
MGQLTWVGAVAPTMGTLEEGFIVPFFSDSDAHFDAVVGYLEDVIMDEDFQLLQRNFINNYYQEFEDTEENKLTYIPIFNEYISLAEKYIEEQLLEQILGFNMAAFTTLQHHEDEVVGDVLQMRLTFTDSPAFKEMFLDCRAEKEGQRLDLSRGLVETSLCKSSSMPASQNNLQHWDLPPDNEWDHSQCHRLSSSIGSAHDDRTYPGKTDSVLQPFIRIKH